MNKMSLPCFFCNDSYIQRIFRICTGETVKNIRFRLMGYVIIIHNFVIESIKNFFRNLLVHRSPPDFIRRTGLIHDVFILGRTTRINARIHHGSTPKPNNALTVIHNIIHHRFNGDVPMNMGQIHQTEFIQSQGIP